MIAVILTFVVIFEYFWCKNQAEIFENIQNV